MDSDMKECRNPNQHGTCRQPGRGCRQQAADRAQVFWLCEFLSTATRDLLKDPHSLETWGSGRHAPVDSFGLAVDRSYTQQEKCFSFSTWMMSAMFTSSIAATVETGAKMEVVVGVTTTAPSNISSSSSSNRSCSSSTTHSSSSKKQRKNKNKDRSQGVERFELKRGSGFYKPQDFLMQRQVGHECRPVGARTSMYDTGGSVDTPLTGVDTMLQTHDKIIQNWSSSVDTRSGSVDTRDSSQKTFWPIWDSVLTLAQVVSTLEAFPECLLGCFGTVCRH
ncbi:hypothetical protein Taro_000075 [Colocasia esculenta]|uniref:Uncharacterized protein n=1 Tax=Colocasia esculenta TaxID=4460 RepID=A0A843TGI0_COLES|nr:hypothetical protein [Colocasia esculenta]